MKGDANRGGKVTANRRVILGRMRTTSVLLVLPAIAIAQGVSNGDTICAPPVMREFRAIWVATVNNIDWPSRRDLTTAEQQQELLAILDRAAELKMNAVVLQVRPEADALYASPYEPWSRYLTGRQGRAPSPAWDPLAFAVREAHQRGLELHAWFNPYRAAFSRDSATARTHVSRQRPDLVVPYGHFLWMNPGLSDVRRRAVRAITDVVRRYDVDGVHIDDYFYPYPESDASGHTIEFPDETTYAAYRRAGGRLEKSDWRRRNVNLFVRDLYRAVKAEKNWVKVGISPFGIYRPGIPQTTMSGIDQYEELSSDVLRWLHQGWLDYIAPQLYWPVQPPEQSYPVLLRWWVQENTKHRHVWPGLALYKLAVSGPRKMRPEDIIQEILITRETPGATGHILFNTRVLMDNTEWIADRLAPVYAEPALVPASPWLDDEPPPAPGVRVVRDSANAADVVHFAPHGNQRVAWWVVQSRIGGVWRTTILPGATRTHILKDDADAELVSVSAVDRSGNASAPVVVRHVLAGGAQ